MEEIRLQQNSWKYDPTDQLGPEGGFGAVFAGESEGGEAVAIKRLKLTADEAAHRELKVADELSDRSFRNVLPVFDSGQDAGSDRYFLVMPKADSSLQEHIENEGALSEKEAAEVLTSIASGALEVADLVHRDLKPANVLWHAGQWKIADFGIARFVQESTSLRTLKQCLSPPYAAPEQWSLERATPATDVYALACIGYTLLTGSPPFNGPTTPDYKNQHLNDDPPALSTAPHLRSLLSMMLRKNPNSRPSLERVVAILNEFVESASEDSDEGWGALAEAGAAVAEQESSLEAEQRKAAQKRRERRDLADAGLEILWDQVEELFRRIEGAAPAAKQQFRGKMTLGQGGIEISEMGANPVSENAFSNCGWNTAVGAIIGVTQSKPDYMWSSSLWYAKRHEDDEWRWREVSYFANAMLRTRRKYQPYFIDVPSDADLAHSRIMSSHQIARGPLLVDDENASDFYERWMDLLARASRGRLSHPSRLPLD